MDELPDGWAVHEIQRLHHHPVCLFMGTPASRVHGHDGHVQRGMHSTALVVAAALVMLVLAFWTGAGQRRSSLHEPRMQLATALGSSALCLSLLWGLDMQNGGGWRMA